MQSLTELGNAVFVAEEDHAVDYFHSNGLKSAQAPYGDFTEVDLRFAQQLKAECAVIILDGYADTAIRARVAEAALAMTLPMSVTLTTKCLEESLGRFLRRNNSVPELLRAVQRLTENRHIDARWQVVEAVRFTLDSPEMAPCLELAEAMKIACK